MNEGYRYSQEPLNSKRELLAEELVPIADILASRKFNPMPFHNSLIQTAAGVWMPPFTERKNHMMEKREFVRVAENSEIALDYSLHMEANRHPTVVIIPGVLGSSSSPFSVGVANKAVHYDFNAVRVNLRSAGNTGSRSSTLYHAGQSEDIRRVFDELGNKGLTEKLYIAATSLGGNIVLKAIGEMGEEARQRIGGIALVSPVVDLEHASVNINRIHEYLVLRTLKKKVEEKAKLSPDNWDTSVLKRIKTIPQWDSVYQTGPKPLRWGFTDVQDYYQKASALRYVSKIAIPTFIIHSQDDPMVSPLPLRGEQFASNPHIFVLKTLHGGHTGFVNFRKTGDDLDRHWAQNRAMEFFRLLEAKT